MRTLGIAVLALLLATALWAQSPPPTSDPAQLQQQIDQLKNTVTLLEQRLAAQEKTASSSQTSSSQPAAQKEDTTSVTDLQTKMKDLGERMNESEKKSVLDRLQWSGDYRYEAHTIRGTIPSHFDGMQLQSYLVRTMFLVAPTSQGGLGMTLDPNMLSHLTSQQLGAFVNGAVQQNYSQYQFFSNNLTFPQLKTSMGAFPAAMQQALMGKFMPLTHVNSYNANNDILQTNRLRLRFEAPVSDNISFSARLSMYKVFGDSTGVQVFNGQPNTLNIDGTTAGVPSGDMIRVEPAFFSWNHIGGSKFYLSIGRRPSTGGPPLNFREDEPRGGTPMGSLIDYQFDGITFGYRPFEKTTLRLCYGQGYSAGFGNGNLLQTPADRLKDVHFFGGNLDIYETDKSSVQLLVARAWNVTDGFNGQVVLPNNPVTGEVVAAPVIMRFTPSANLGAINLYGLNLQKTWKWFDMFVNGNMVSLRPNGVTTPFGGLGSDPFDTPTDHNGTMIYAGLRFNVPYNDGRTKIGFEFNHGSKYWFNFAQAEDDILMPKTATRGEAYEAYLTHRITDHFIFKAGYIRYDYTYSGSGWHLGAPKNLNDTPLLGFPTYKNADVFTAGLTARF